MPMPTPREGESKEDFIARFMGDDAMVEEYPEADQRRAVAEKQWDEKAEKAEAAGEEEEHLQATEHRARQRDPGDFVRLRELWSNEGVRGIGGPLKTDPGGGAVVQVVAFDSGKFTPAEAKAWLKENDYKADAFTEAEMTPKEKEEDEAGAFGMKIEGIEALRPGTFTAATGEAKVTEQDIDDAIRNFAEYSEVPAVLGHELKTDTPAAGWVGRMIKIGKKLVLALKDVPARVAEMVGDKALRKVSLGFSRLPGKGMVIRHVGLLGAHPPAVPGLADIPEATLASARTAEVVLLYEEEGDDEMDRNRKLLAAEVREARAAAAAAKTSAESYRSEIETLARERKTETLVAAADRLVVGEKRLPPAARDRFVALGKALLGADPFGKAEVELAAGKDKEPEKEPAWRSLIRLVESLPVNAAFAEMGAAGALPRPETTAAAKRREEMGKLHLATWNDSEEFQKLYPDSAVYVEGMLAADGFEAPPKKEEPKNDGDGK